MMPDDREDEQQKQVGPEPSAADQGKISQGAEVPLFISGSEPSVPVGSSSVSNPGAQIGGFQARAEGSVGTAGGTSSVEGVSQTLKPEGIASAEVVGTPEVRAVQPDQGYPQDAFSKASLGDVVTSVDKIGFQPYVQAIAEFLADPETMPPLTLSIEGEWGMGKSSFMRQLEARLELKGIKSVWFNAWRHDKDEALWSSFALEFQSKLSGKMKMKRQRVEAWASLFLRRLKWVENILDLVTFIIQMGIYIGIASFALAFIFHGPSLVMGAASGVRDAGLDEKSDALRNSLLKIGGPTSLLIVALQLAKKFKDIVGNPLALDFKKMSKAPDYEGKRAFVERFHEDFKDVLAVYAEGKKICVFVDDLDRCEIPKSADLIQALNMMMPDAANVFFVVGMDREKVAAAIAVKHEKLLPYVAPAKARFGDARAGIDPSAGLAFGYNYLEKFIQLPFQLPAPTTAGAERLLYTLAATSDPGSAPPETIEQLKQPSKEEMDELRSKLHWEENAIYRMVAPFLENNPRRLKQFVNAFRLKAYIAFLTDTLAPSTASDLQGRYTLTQIGKFVAIGLRWPRFFTALDEEPRLLGKLQEIALGSAIPDGFVSEGTLAEWGATKEDGLTEDDKKKRERSPLKRWAEEPTLIQLLRAGSTKDHLSENPPLTLEPGHLDFNKAYIKGFLNFDPAKLLQISPARKLPPEPPSPDAAKSPRETVRR